jgi:hypothetical protein
MWGRYANTGHERVDPNWRDADPEAFVVKPFAAIRLMHDGIRLGVEDCGIRSGKVFTSPTVCVLTAFPFLAFPVLGLLFVRLKQFLIFCKWFG